MKGKKGAVVEVQGFSPASSYREIVVHSKQNAVQEESLMRVSGLHNLGTCLKPGLLAAEISSSS